jgi:hypothetical protein
MVVGQVAIELAKLQLVEARPWAAQADMVLISFDVRF